MSSFARGMELGNLILSSSSCNVSFSPFTDILVAFDEKLLKLYRFNEPVWTVPISCQAVAWRNELEWHINADNLVVACDLELKFINLESGAVCKSVSMSEKMDKLFWIDEFILAQSSSALWILRGESRLIKVIAAVDRIVNCYSMNGSILASTVKGDIFQLDCETSNDHDELVKQLMAIEKQLIQLSSDFESNRLISLCNSQCR